MRRALIVVGKAPVAGTTKTRLVPPLSAEEAARLYQGFLMDALDLALSLGWERVSVIHPRGDGPLLGSLLSGQVQVIEQVGSGLSNALSEAFERHIAEGFERVVLIGSDNPTLTAEPIEQACAALDGCDVSLGPTADGGYYLMGLAAPHAGLFANISWSTARVYAETLSRAAELNLRVHEVAPWYDVDTPQDLERLCRELLSSCEPAGLAPHTRAALERLRPPYGLGGTSTVGVRPERSAYAAAMRSPAARPWPH